MTSLLALFLLALGPAHDQASCTFPHEEALATESGTMRYLFIDSCGRPYEVGYRLEGSTLHFPRGGRHSLPEDNGKDAEAVLRETYGLVGAPDKLKRTRW